MPPVEVGRGPQPAFDDNPGYAVFRTTARLPAFDPERRMAAISFTGIKGSARVFANGEHRASKVDAGAAPVTVPLPDCGPGAEVTLSVLVRSEGNRGGITGNVMVVMGERSSEVG